jgi:hypothetical protein
LDELVGRPVPRMEGKHSRTPAAALATPEHGMLVALDASALGFARWAHTQLGCPWGDHAASAAAESGAMTRLATLVRLGAPLGQRTCTAAARAGSLRALVWLVTVARCPWDALSAAVAASRHGHLDVLRWLAARQAPHFSEACLVATARGGHIRVAQWLSRCGLVVPAECEGAAAAAARHGHMRCLALLLHLGCPLNGDALAEVASQGDLDALRHLEIHRPCVWNANILSAAARNGHWGVVRWLRERECPWTEEVFSAAAIHNDAAVMAWLWRERCPFSVWTTWSAARAGSFEALRWLHRKGCPINERTLTSALRVGRFDIADWLRRAAGIELTSNMASELAFCGHFAAVRWLRERMPAFCGAGVIAGLARSGNIEALEWARDVAGCPWEAGAWTSAASCGNLPVLEWLAARRDLPYAPDGEACVAAADNGQLTALRWLHARGCPLSPRVFVSAVEGCQLDMLRWLRGQGCHWPPLRCIVEAREMNKPWLEQWLRDCYDADLAAGRTHLLADDSCDAVYDPADIELAKGLDQGDGGTLDWSMAIDPDAPLHLGANAVRPRATTPIAGVLDLAFEHESDTDAHSQEGRGTEEEQAATQQ